MQKLKDMLEHNASNDEIAEYVRNQMDVEKYCSLEDRIQSAETEVKRLRQEAAARSAAIDHLIQYIAKGGLSE